MIIVDTSAWIYLFEKNPGEKNNLKAKQLYERNTEPLVVTDLIIEETHKWLVHHGTNEKIALKILDGFVHEKLAKILPIHPQDRIDATKLVEKYLDQTLSYTDAITVMTMKRYNLKKIFSFDSHFDLFRGIERIP